MTQDPLAVYYRGTQRFASQLGGRTGLRAQIDAWLNELQVPATLDPEGDWRLINDAGRFTLWPRDEDRRLVIRQNYNDLGDNLKRHAGQLHSLMLLNLDSDVARFASVMNPHSGKYMIVLTAQVPYEGLDRDGFLNLIEPAFRLSSAFDQLMRGEVPQLQPQLAEPAQPGACAADWYADPQGQARLRYWDGSAWTEHVSQ